jgi:hypothetical protein
MTISARTAIKQRIMQQDPSICFPYSLLWEFAAHAHKIVSFRPIQKSLHTIPNGGVLNDCAKFGKDRLRTAPATARTHTHRQTHTTDFIIYPAILRIVRGR